LIRIALSVAAALVVTTAAAARPFPAEIALPTGFQPEGIAIGPGHTFYVGSIPTGRVYKGDLRTGQSSELVPTQAGRNSIGLAVDHRGRLFVAGGGTGDGYVYNAKTGAPLAAFDFEQAPDPTFVNDVVVTRTAAWFTDSNQKVLYRVAIAPSGELGGFTSVPLSGDIVFGANINTNGIDATPNGKTLIIVQSNTGKLFTVNADGVTDEIELTGGNVQFGDGILLDGKTLYVVQNQLNQIAVVKLSPDLASGTIVGHITSGLFQIPTTIDEHGKRLYAVNARFNLAPADRPTASYSVAQVLKNG
jgi:sugar lactone lactonase YvrE